MKAWKKHKGIAASILKDDIDTDQILPKQFMKLIGKEGFGNHLFFDWRYMDEEGKVPNPEFVLNQTPYDKASILISGANFGCGSSREHAPWAIAGFGLKAVIATSFADIFSINAPKNGIALIRLNEKEVMELSKFTTKQEIVEISIDLEEGKVYAGENEYSFVLAENAKQRIVNGWDDIDITLQKKEEIDSFKKKYFSSHTYYRLAT
ncbi:3-isopropylmalate dehydratase small subunit [Leptospira ilyithenensis]|uniref:3-isopropylmalate dehydratase small subunit n=1 Tax=Leptospira ilyithenensis TaxID=2484901 RepID=A0A4R9LNZ3_9LEPT|nr:3-isopropylmalate dehydratase small subunit [Leptospira ilyithenensis]TGN08467.1 3-isopropylmalate dehydratase small subunit [Leptospira ilyithenensis]